MTLLEDDVKYFNNGQLENEKFWKRLKGKPNFTNASVLEVGCGHGRLCVDVALAGARKVVGVDTHSRLVEFAKENLQTNYSDLSSEVEFHSIDLADLNDKTHFDYILSKDSFEHIIDLDIMLEEMNKRKKII